jgi:hypothetical protein
MLKYLCRCLHVLGSMIVGSYEELSITSHIAFMNCRLNPQTNTSLFSVICLRLHTL